MKKFLAIFLTICLLFIFSSCTSNNETTNPYQVTEKATKITEDFDSQEISKITVTIGGNETEINITDEMINLLDEANNTSEVADEELSTIAAFIKIYYDEKEIDYGVIYLDSASNAYISSNYNKNDNTALKIEDQSIISKLIFPE